MSHRRRHRLKIRSLYVWHRYVGLSAAIFVVLLAISGIALNHTEAFALDSRYVRSRLLLDWYGIEAPESALGVDTALGSVMLLGTKLYVAGRPLDGEFQSLNGAVAERDLLIVAVDDDLLLLSGGGDYLERLSEGDGAPGPVEALGMDAQRRIIARTPNGNFRSDIRLLDWQDWNEAEGAADWSATAALSGPAIAAARADYVGRILPWERVVLDLHSGRLFGSAGPWLMDAAAVLMLFLAGSGVLMWWRRQR